MSFPYQIFIPLLGLFFVRVDLTDLFPLRLPVRVSEVLDGDTIKVHRGKRQLRIRLQGIDAPEAGQPFVSGGDAGAASTACLKRLLGLRTVWTLRIHGHDMYRRVLGELEGLTEELLRAGCTGLYPHARFSSKGEKYRLLRDYQRARRERRGLWAQGGYRQPKDWRRLSKRSAPRRSHRRGHSQGPYPPGRRPAPARG